MRTVAFIGLGEMGRRMAARLLAAGYELVVWNRTPAKARALLSAGATPARSPADAARRAHVVITMVSDPGALEAVTGGSDGVLAGLRPASTLIEMSTVGPQAIGEVASRLPPGTGLLDAPVLGSVAEAEAGSLTIFVGGSLPLVEQATPLLSELGTVLHVGDNGAGAAAKLVANATLFTTLGALGEALALAQGLGFSPEISYQILETTPLAAQAERRRRVIQAGDYPPRFPLALARKDAGLIREAARVAGIYLRLAHASEGWLSQAQSMGFGDRDYTAVLAMILDPGGRTGSTLAGGAVSSERGTDSPVLDPEGLIFDLDGVIWRGDVPIDGAAEAIDALRARGVRVLFLTNEPRRSRNTIAARLSSMGIPATAADVMTSAVATARAIRTLDAHHAPRVLALGPPALTEEMESEGLQIVAAGEADGAEVVAVAGHEGFNYGELCAATTAIRSGARLFATGRDAVFPTAAGLRPATGAILAAVETAGGTSAVVVGKPERLIFEIARDALGSCRGVAVVGDHLVADVGGAKRAGMTSILVLSGVTARADIAGTDVVPDLVLDSIAQLPDALADWRQVSSTAP